MHHTYLVQWRSMTSDRLHHIHGSGLGKGRKGPSERSLNELTSTKNYSISHMSNPLCTSLSRERANNATKRFVVA